jgi:hypothetical protein
MTKIMIEKVLDLSENRNNPRPVQIRGFLPQRVTTRSILPNAGITVCKRCEVISIGREVGGKEVAPFFQRAIRVPILKDAEVAVIENAKKVRGW